MAKLGRIAFLVGLVLAVLAAFVTNLTWVLWVLAVLGLIVGFLNITEAETQNFLLAAIGLIISATAVQAIPYVGDILTRITSNIAAFIAAAVLVVALRTLFQTARD